MKLDEDTTADDMVRALLEPLKDCPEAASMSVRGFLKRWFSGFLLSASLILCVHLGLEGVTAAYAVLPLWAILTWLVATEIRQWLRYVEGSDRLKMVFLNHCLEHLAQQHRLNERGAFVKR